MKKDDHTKRPQGDEEEIRLQLPTPNLKALLDPTSLTPEEVFERLPLAWKEFSEGGVKEVTAVWEERFGGPPALAVVSEKLPPLPLGLSFSVALGHMRALTKSRHLRPYHQLIAEEVIKQETKTTPNVRWVDALARALLERLTEVYSTIGLELVTMADLESPKGEEGMLCYDARAARLYYRFGKEGKVMAGHLKKKSAALWENYRAKKTHAKEALWSSCWASPREEMRPCMFAKVFAMLLWRCEVKAQVEREEKTPAALSAKALHHVSEVSFSKERTIQFLPEGGELLTEEGGEVIAKLEPIPSLSLSDLEATQRCFDRLRTLNGHRVLRSQIITAHQQYLNNSHRYDRIEIEGGWADVAKWAGAREKDRDEIAEIVKAQAVTILQWPNGNWGNFLKLDLYTATGRQRGLVAMTLSDFLLPHFVNRLLPKDGTLQRQRDRQLIPIVDLPPFVGRPNDWAAQATFQLYLVGEMRVRAEELYLRGAVQLSRHELERLADRAELPKSIIEEVIERWARDDQDGKAFLVKQGEDRYSLAKSHQQALEFIKEAGRDVSGGRRRGQKSVENKTKARAKPHSKKKK
jgi:hypothetical protein